MNEIDIQIIVRIFDLDSERDRIDCKSAELLGQFRLGGVVRSMFIFLT